MSSCSWCSPTGTRRPAAIKASYRAVLVYEYDLQEEVHASRTFAWARRAVVSGLFVENDLKTLP